MCRYSEKQIGFYSFIKQRDSKAPLPHEVAVASSQTWEIDFAGSINNGLVDLNSLGGTLSDLGGLISSSIEANLGGVFTGIGADAFVGGFELINEINQFNQFNQVDGIYIIER